MSEPLDLDGIRARFDAQIEWTGDGDEFINRLYASARDIPALLAEVDRLRPVAEAARVAAQPLAKMTRYFPESAGRSSAHEAIVALVEAVDRFDPPAGEP